MGVLGIVIIGRNEGARLVVSLQSALAALPPERIVYVDSNSKDDSVATAEKLGVSIVQLDGALPLTAARARNAGFEYLLATHSHIEYVQFVDGDCELVPGWLETALRFLARQPGIALICGRTRERHPDRSLYNWLCDEEWNAPVGEAETCGGNVMLRVTAFKQVSGFRPSIISAEDAELCVRLREQDWKAWRLDDDMVVHDAAITSFGQWWRRTARGGYGFAEVFQLHKSSPLRIWRRETMRINLWAGFLPVMVVAGGMLSKLALCGFLLYPAQVCRIAIGRGATRARSWLYAVFMVLARFAELHGSLRYHLSRWNAKIPTSLGHKDVR